MEWDDIQQQCSHHFVRWVQELCSECGAVMPSTDYIPSDTSTTNKTVVLNVRFP